MKSPEKKRTLTARAKDAALRKALLHFLRPRFEHYGEILKFELDTTAKVILAEVMLKGEALPFVISEARYRIEKDEQSAWIVFYGMKVSREWTQNLLDDQIPEIRLKMPALLEVLL